jgi:hypothetical protein
MTRRAARSTRSASDGATVVQAVTAIMGVVVGLTFLFGFGNVLNLALRLGVPLWVAPLVPPAVDLSILGLLLGTRHLALAGASAELLLPARRLLIFASVVTLALNVAAPLVAGDYGKAAFDAVGPLLLIGWAEVGPDLLRALTTTDGRQQQHPKTRSWNTPRSTTNPSVPDQRYPTVPGRTRRPPGRWQTSRVIDQLPGWLTTICLNEQGKRTRAIGTCIADRSLRTHSGRSSTSALPAPDCSLR